MILLVKIIVGIVTGYLLLCLVVPPGNFMYEIIRLPFWLLKINNLPKPEAPTAKIKYGKHFRQYLLHFVPAANSSPKKHVVVYIHGSGWQLGRPELFKANARWFTEQGYHAFFLSHRRIPQCDIRQLRMDTALAIKRVLETMSLEGLSEMKIILCGNSAGGNLGALALLDHNLLTNVGLSSEIFSGLALFAAPLDLTKMWPSPPLLMLTRMKKADLFRLANPICYLESAPNLPILLIHGDKDGIVEYKNTSAFVSKLESLGAKNIQFATLNGGNHLDSASWCIPHHPCSHVFKTWLQNIENQQIG